MRAVARIRRSEIRERNYYATSSCAKCQSDRTEKFRLDLNFLNEPNAHPKSQILEQPTNRFAVHEIDCGRSVPRSFAASIGGKRAGRYDQPLVRPAKGVSSIVVSTKKS